MKKLLLITIISCLGFMACQKQTIAEQVQTEPAAPKQEEMSEEELGKKISQAIENKDWQEVDRLLTEYAPKGPITISYDKDEIYEDGELYTGENVK